MSNLSKALGIVIMFFCFLHIYALDTTVVPDDPANSKQGIREYPYGAAGADNGNIAQPDGKQIDRAELERKARNLNFDEKKKKEEERDTPNSNLPQLKTFTPGEFVKTLSFILALGLLLAVLVYLVFKTGKKTISTSQMGLASAAEWEEAWNLEEGEADGLYANALTEGNFRLAIRFSYLRNLRLLMDRKLVAPSPEKTNSQYARELESVALSALFTQITRVYETVWYGEAKPDQPTFERAILGFNEMYVRAGKA